MDESMQEMLAYIESIQSESLSFLKELVNTDSSSKDKQGVDQVGKVLQEKLKANEISFKIIENDIYGNHMIAKIPGNKQGKILLMGHQDTALPKGDALKRPFQKDGNLLKGPGVSDMKSGLVYMIYAALALKKHFANEMCDIELLFTPEEELGSPISKDIIKERAKDADIVFNIEPARPDGTIVTSRKGAAHLQIEIEGTAAHSGAFYEDGISANDELALKMVEIKKLTNLEKGITVNFGMIDGGISNNIVSPHANATIHCTFWKEKDFQEMYQRIQDIVDYSYVEGTRAKLSGSIGMYPMEENAKNRKVYDVVLEAAEMLELPVIGKSTKGAADAGLTSSIGIPTICGMGPVGGNWHREDEYLELDSFIPRLKLLAVSMLLFSQK